MKKFIPLALVGASALVVASPASAANVTIDWKDPSKTTNQITAGESVTWNVVEGGHNVDVYQGPETFVSTSGKDPKGTQFTHVFNTPGTYQFVCDYHSGMKGTITVAAAQPAPQPSPSPSPSPTPSPSPKPGGTGRADRRPGG
jgi:plastocyanin